MSAEKPRRLGRGLEALISSAATPSQPPSDLQRIPVARVRPNPYQPRRDFDPAELADLQASIRASGLLQPITVRRKGDAYELIAGERRFRAVSNLGWSEVPAIVRDFDDQTLLVLALVENLQRADLNALEEARGYERLIKEFSLTQQQVAEAVGKDRSTVANLLRVLALPAAIQRMIEQGALSAGHARALLPLGDEKAMIELAQEVVARGLSVREVEQRARGSNSESSEEPKARSGSSTAPASGPARHDPVLTAAEDEIRRHLQTDVSIALTSQERGAIKITFYSNEDFERIIELVLGRKFHF
jgi:ParB family chromosome partitioning protein